MQRAAGPLLVGREGTVLSLLREDGSATQAGAGVSRGAIFKIGHYPRGDAAFPRRDGAVPNGDGSRKFGDAPGYTMGRSGGFVGAAVHLVGSSGRKIGATSPFFRGPAHLGDASAGFGDGGGNPRFPKKGEGSSNRDRASLFGTRYTSETRGRLGKITWYISP